MENRKAKGETDERSFVPPVESGQTNGEWTESGQHYHTHTRSKLV